MVLVVNNFVEEGDLYREMVLNSKVFGIVMDAAHFKQANVTFFLFRLLGILPSFVWLV